MKMKFGKRVFSFVLTLAMVLSLLSTAVFAESVTTAPGNTSLEVEYINSTLFNWDESAANAATALADYSGSGTSYTGTTISNTNNLTQYTNGSYFYYADNSYVQVTALSASGSGNSRVWSINNGAYTSTGKSLTLYKVSTTGSYEGKGFYFTSVSPSEVTVPAFSSWDTSKSTNVLTATAMQQYSYYSGLAASKLSDSSNAPFSDAVNAADLFSTTEYDWKAVYQFVGVPFVYDKDTGYYELNSDKNAVYFANGAQSGTGENDLYKLTIADKPAAFQWSDGSDGSGYYTVLQPFNTVSTSTQNAYISGGKSTTSAYPISGSVTYGFGMVTDVKFQMTDDGLSAVDGQPITFDFSGDDDVWVYVDGVLALDIGGTHDAIQGSINFATGDVTVRSDKYSYIRDKNTSAKITAANTTGSTLVDSTNGIVSGSYIQRNLYEALGTTLTGFASQGTHTLTIYYMDRGRGSANCTIKFNLPQRDSVSVTKKIAENYDGMSTTIPKDVMDVLNNVNFQFTAYKNGDPVPNKSFSIYDENNNLVGPGSTDDNGGFTLKNGETAIFKNISLDDGVSYYMVEDTSGLSDRWGTPSWTAASSVKGAGITGGNGATSDTVTVTGSETATDTVSFVCTNSYRYESNLAVDANNDTIVIDYGLPVEVDVRRNDLISNGDFESLTVAVPDGESGESADGTYGTVEVTEDNKLLYTPTKPLSGLETFTYTLTAKDSTTDETVADTATLTIIPATSVYYEENFGTENDPLVTPKTNNATFTTEGNPLTGYQETGYVGDSTDSPYGADAVYLNNLGDSYGTSLKVDTTNGAAQYSYTFTGTGTTIYGRLSNVTGYIRVKVTDSAKEVVDSQYIDTINLVTVPEGETAPILDAMLYNIPIYQNTDFGGYDTYTVTIYVYQSGTLHETNNEFYLDGIRVFQPMGTSTLDNAGYATANSAYSADGEQNAAVINIRDKIVSDCLNDYEDKVFTLTDVEGEITDVETYSDIGPNQELYLKDGYNVSFALVNWDSQSYKLYLGMKAPNGKAAKVAVGSGTFEINNSADCYYDISDYVEVQQTLEDGTAIGYVYIEGVSGLTALTNLKVTGVDAFDLAYSEDFEADNEEISADGEEDIAPTLYLVSRTFADNLAAEVEEAPAFTPDSINVSCSYAKILKLATVNVVTSKDVSYVTINGVKVTGRTFGGKIWFTKAYTRVTAGTTYEIVAYNADGVASETYTATAQ